MVKIEVSDVRVTPIIPNKSLVAFCSFLVNESLFVGDIGLHVCAGHAVGYRLVFPDKLLFNGKRVNLIFPVNRETELYLTQEIVKAYEKVVGTAMKKEREKFGDGGNHEEVEEG